MERSNDPKYKAFDSESDSDSEATSLGSAESLDVTSGPNFADFARSLVYDKSNFTSNRDYYHPFTSTIRSPAANKLVQLDEPLPADAHKLYGKSKFESARKDVTSMFLIDSKNRDKKSYPQPTNFTLKPPRVYKNVVSIQVTQIKLLSSFFYFRTSKANTVLPVIERGREDINIYLGYFLTAAVTIPEGTYNVNDLLSNLQTRMNYTPIFYDFPNEFSDFVTAFTTNGDLSVNFNQPGDTYYDTLSDKYVNNPTMDQIVSYYWGNRYPGLTEYSLDQVKSAYYYPVIYELILDEGHKTIYPFFNQEVPAALLGSGESVRSRIVYNSSGLNDAVVLHLINNNLGVLNQYRRENTFRKYLVNRYQVAYDTNSLRVNIVSLTLNTSLINLFNLTSARSFASALSDNGFTPASYSNVSNTLARAKVIYTDMYNYIQNNMTKYFAIGFATYSSQYFINTSNVIFIQNGLNASGIRTGYTAAYLTSGEVPIASTNVTYSNAPVYWPRFNSTLTIGGLGGGIDLSGINVSTSMIPYNMIGSNFIFGGQVIDSSNYHIQTDKSSRSVNSVITINPAKYTVFKFRSPARQTLQVETLPLPYYYRFGDYNKLGNYKGILDPSNNNVPQRYFDISYAFVYNSTNGMKYRNDLMDSSKYSTLTLSPTFGDNFDTAFFQSESLPLNVQSNYAQFEFTAPYPDFLAVSTGLTAYNTCLSFVSVDSNAISTLWADNVEAYIYHDRAAFMADIEFTRKENTNHYIQSNAATVDQSDITFNISTFAGHKYYAILRSSDLGFPNMLFNPVIYYPTTSYVQVRTDYVDFDPLGNPYDNSNITNYPFVTNYNTDFLRLPVASSLQGIDPANPQFTNSVVVQGKPIGYDISGISNDLTDYQGYIPGQVGFVPNTTFRIDPLSKYTFQSLTPVDSNTTSYFGTGSQNRILQPVTNQPYTFKGTSSSQIKIVHWYDGYSIPQQIQDGFITSNAISSGITASLLDLVPGTTNTILQGYPTNSNGEIKFGQGINAIGFLPTDGLYEISSFTYKSVLYPTNNISTTTEDPNTQIKYIGVFSGSYLASKTIAISSALTVLKYANSVVYNPSTLSNTPNFGVQYGTWYEYGYDPSFVVASNVKISGYTQGPSELLSYDSMYYMVPFNSNGSNITYSRLAGSVLPYPLFQTISTGPTYFGQQTKATPGVNPQASYVIPVNTPGANSGYGPQGTVAYTQSQYEQSQAITTTSIGFREYGYLVRNTNAMFTFNTSLSNSAGMISTGYVGLTTAFTEYNDTLYLVNTLSNNANISNANLSFTGARYASSISTVIGIHGGSTDCIEYLINTPSTIQNFSFSGSSNFYSTITYQDTITPDNITLRSYQFDVTTQFATLWLWGAGGGANAGIGGAGAYVKAQIDIQQLLQIKPPNAPLGVSTVYIVVGRGGDSSMQTSAGTSNGGQGFEQLKYGGGGTSIYKDPDQGSVYYQTRGGGFTGLFTNSNLSDPDTLPLIIVGGGGGGGNALSNLGGPGGFGRLIELIPDTVLYFSSATFSGTYSPTIPFTSIQDIDFNYSDPGGPISNAIDGNLTTLWNPTGSPYMNPGNFNPTPNTYRVNMSFGSNVSTISRLRLYLASEGNTANIATGIVAYNNSNKSQLLFSNTNIQTSNMQIINSLYAYDITSLSTIGNTTINANAWIMGGIASDYVENMLQYSLDGSNWARVTSVGPTLPGNLANSVLYVASLNAWFTCGSGAGVNYGASAGLTWSSNSMPTVTASGNSSSVAVAAAGQYQIAAVGGFWISSNYGESWSATSTTSGAQICAISASGQYMALSINNVINVSSNYGTTFTPITTLQVTTGWVGLAMSANGQYMVANAYDTSKLYVSSNYGVTWTVSLTQKQWTGVSMSASGKYIIATTVDVPQISSNYGLTFSNINALGSLFAYASAISANGNYMLIANWNGMIRISSNYGASWISVISAPTRAWYGAAMSSSGRYMSLGVLNSGSIWVSSNFGVTWTERTSLSTGSWGSVSMSGDGKYQLGLTTNGGALTPAVYRSVAADPSFTSSPILRSTDGLNWTACLVIECDNDEIRTLSYANGLLLAGGMRGSAGCIMVSTDGIRWTYSGISGVFSPSSGGVANIKYLNGAFWAAGSYDDGSGSGLKKSTDGITWTTVLIASSNIIDIAFGLGRYVVAAVPSPPYNIGLIWSSDGITWTAASPVNIPGIYAYSIAFGNNTFVAGAASVTDGSSYLKYSLNGINWFNANFPTPGNVFRRQIKFANGIFMSVGYGQPGTGRAPNQLSAVSSRDGISWTFTLSGGHNSDRNSSSQGFGVDYGPISIIPNVSTMYLEIQKTTNNQPYIYDIQAFTTERPIDPQGPNNSISSLIDNNITTRFYPSETQTVGINSYPIVVNFSTAVSTINKLQFYAPSGLTSAYFTGLTVQTDLTRNVIFQDTSIQANSFINASNYSYYETLIVPPLMNISTLFMNVRKNTANSIQLIEARALYDLNLNITSYNPTLIEDLNTRGGILSNVIDRNISTFWTPTTYQTNDRLRLKFTFSTAVDNLNRVQIYSGLSNDTTRVVNGVYIYADSTKANILYSNDSAPYNTYSNYNRFDLSISPLSNASAIYIELAKSSAGTPHINEINFFKVGSGTDTPAGYTGGTLTTMKKSVAPTYKYDGGGGSNTTGGVGGSAATGLGDALDALYVQARNEYIQEIVIQNFNNAKGTIGSQLNNITNYAYIDFNSLNNIPGVSIGYSFNYYYNNSQTYVQSAVQQLGDLYNLLIFGGFSYQIYQNITGLNTLNQNLAIAQAQKVNAPNDFNVTGLTNNWNAIKNLINNATVYDSDTTTTTNLRDNPDIITLISTINADLVTYSGYADVLNAGGGLDYVNYYGNQGFGTNIAILQLTINGIASPTKTINGINSSSSFDSIIQTMNNTNQTLYYNQAMYPNLDTEISNAQNAINDFYNQYGDPATIQTKINQLNAINFGPIQNHINNINNYGNSVYYAAFSINNLYYFINYDINYYSDINSLVQGLNYSGYYEIPNNLLPNLPSLISAINSYNGSVNTLNSQLQSIDLYDYMQYGIYFSYDPYYTADSSYYSNVYNTINGSVQAITSAISSAQAPVTVPANTMTAGLNGTYLKGGSPGVITVFPDYGILPNVGGGGGGGGYYGGGGGSRDGAGGGGAGYLYSASLFNLIDYGVAVPASNGLPVNYIPPGFDEQNILLSNSFIPPSSRLAKYGQGAYGSQLGAHGLAVFTYIAPQTVQPLNTTTEAFPKFVDGSRMALFKAPLTYDTENRRLNFTNYSDVIETSSHAGYNWVWYRSYLSLVGQTLQTSMRPSGSIPSLPTANFPNLAGVVYSVLADQYNNVSTFFRGNRTSANISTITNAVGLSLGLHTAFLTQTLRSDPQYYELTEIYGLLDYLRNPTNLLRPHLDPRNPQLDRIFGGVPRFGYWANPFLTNTSYIGFDVAASQYPTSALSNIVGVSKPVTAMYGLVLEQSLSSGKYEVKDLMAYKPTLAEATSSNWLIASQFPESYVTRSMINFNVTSNVPVQPYTMKSAIQGQLPLFNYKVYTTPNILDSNTTINVPIHMINDFQGTTSFFYSFQNISLDNVSSISLTTRNMTSTLIHINQTNITSLSNAASNIIGTVLSEYPASTLTNVVTKFGLANMTTRDYTPTFQFNTGNGYYNNYTDDSPLTPETLGKGINDYNGNFYAADRLGGSNLYQNICTFKVYQEPFTKQSFDYKSPSFILSEYLNNNSNPSYDYLISKYTNIWHVQGTRNLSTIYGARLTSPFDFNITTNFINQVFYPTHKIILTKKGSSLNPMIDAFDLSNYPSYPRTEMFFYKNYSTMIRDISGQFAMEKTSNFAYSDMTSGYFFNSYINNINLTKSDNYNNNHPNSFNYLAIRAYSPSETFKALVRFYLPGRYDFGYISLRDLSNEIVTVQAEPTVNPEYKTTLGLYTSSFAVNRVFGATGLPGFSGSNISSVGFGDFLNQYINIYNTIELAGTIASTVNGRVLAGTSNLVTGDLRFILPPYIASRERVTDPIEFMLPLSTVVADSNRLIDEYGLGYNLGFEQQDTAFNTVQRAGSFFKILDDYIYLKMNEEFDMNRLDITTKEDLQATQDSTAQPNLYNCKLILNNFGTFATTFVQNPVTFNPIVGKLDKLKFTWYDITGQIIDNTECEWSGAVQIVEKMDIATDDSTVTKAA